MQVDGDGQNEARNGATAGRLSSAQLRRRAFGARGSGHGGVCFAHVCNWTVGLFLVLLHRWRTTNGPMLCGLDGLRSRRRGRVPVLQRGLSAVPGQVPHLDPRGATLMERKAALGSPRYGEWPLRHGFTGENNPSQCKRPFSFFVALWLAFPEIIPRYLRPS